MEGESHGGPAHAPLGPGAAIDRHGQAWFRVWAPQARTVEMVLTKTGDCRPLIRADDGYFTLLTDGIAADSLYMYRVDGSGPWPDPCSRYQPQGPHGPSQLVASDRYQWRDAGWRGVTLAGQVIYELHVGTFTREGTLDAARQKLGWLRETGVTLIEIMPIAEFPGQWNWGYDGVQFFAPFHGYGDHEALKRFVDAAHDLDLGVILDVVYNHFGPDGNYLGCYSPYYFNAARVTEWGESLNFDGEHCEGIRDLVIHNAAYWIREFHLDGLRLDATQAIFDASRDHVVAALVSLARATAAPRSIVVIAENEHQNSQQLQPPECGGYGIDAIWNDDFHHSARVAATGSRDGYYHDYRGRAQELISAIRHGFLFQGQFYQWQKRPRGTPLRGVQAAACVHFLQNHDQVGNSYAGRRLDQDARYRALAALLLLGPQTPLLFMGQEFGSSRPFHFFADHGGELRDRIWQGRREFMCQFEAHASAGAQARIPDPADRKTFADSTLDWTEVERNTDAVRLHRDLLRLRREDPVIAAREVRCIDGATLAEFAFVMRWHSDEYGDRLLLVNLDREQVLAPAPEPLLAPCLKARWQLVWTSEQPCYGGHGEVMPVDEEQRWHVPAYSATVLRSAATSG